MDAAVDGIPPIMWEPDRSMSTKMDELRVRINEKYNVDLPSLSILLFAPTKTPTDSFTNGPVRTTISFGRKCGISLMLFTHSPFQR